MKKILTTSNKLLLGLLVAVLLFITLLGGIAKYYGLGPNTDFEFEKSAGAATPPAPPVPPTPPAPPVPGE